MARSAETSADSCHPAPPTSAVAAVPSRITKTRLERTSSRQLRQSSRSLEHLQNMVNEAQNDVAGERGSHVKPHTGPGVKGKAKLKAIRQQSDASHDVEMDTVRDSWTGTARGTWPAFRNKNDQSFPIMELPTEIRLEIYRACLTRPYNILLSKRETLQQADSEDPAKNPVPSESQSDAEETDDDTVLAATSSNQVPAGTTGSTNLHRPTISRLVPSHSSRSIRLLSNRSATGSSASSSSNAQAVSWAPTTGTSATNPAVAVRSATSRSAIRNGNGRGVLLTANEPPRNQSADPFIVNILQASKAIYKEARSVLYSENFFTLDLNTAMGTLACLHQRSRRQIKHVELEIPTYNEILERFQETVRLSLRYCSGLKKFVIHMPFTLPGADGSGTTGNTTVYANGFDILRWLPQECEIILKGNICIEIETVVNKHLRLARTLDRLAYARRQLISNDTGTPSAVPTVIYAS